MKTLYDTLLTFTPAGIAFLIFALILIVMTIVFKKIQTSRDSVRINRKLLMYIITLTGVFVIIITLPIDRQLKGQILSFLGILISATVALSSTTILGNLIAGIMNNSMDRFRNGDLINVGDIQGRVTKKSVFHIEIQLQDSNFLTIPNLYIATNPVKLIRSNDTVISASVSLGYDVPRIKIEECLKQAALDLGLKDPFVYITELGDYAVSYRVHGFLEDSEKYFSTISALKGKIMDELHKNNIEIVSPSFMNQRRVDENNFIPQMQMKKERKIGEKSPDEMVFDKAMESEKLEKKKDYIDKIEEEKTILKEQLKESKSKEETKKIKNRLNALDEQQKSLLENIESRKENLNKKK